MTNRDSKEQLIQQNLEMLGGVEIELQVEVGTTTLPLRDVIAFKTGETLALGMHSSEPVKLRIGDKVIAYCSLITKDGKRYLKIGEVAATGSISDLVKVV